MNHAIVYGLRESKSKFYFYVGSTKKNKAHRLQAHLQDSINRRHPNRHLQNKINKVGVKNVVIDVLVTCDEISRWEIESRWIKYFNSLGHPLVNIMHNDDHVRGFHTVAENVVDVEIDLTHIELVVRVLEGAYQPTGDSLHDMILQCLTDTCIHILHKHPQELLQHVDELTDEQTNGQAAGIRKRILAMLERDRSS